MQFQSLVQQQITKIMLNFKQQMSALEAAKKEGGDLSSVDLKSLTDVSSSTSAKDEKTQEVPSSKPTILAQQSSNSDLQKAINILLQQQKNAKKGTSLVQTSSRATQQLTADDFDKCDSAAT